MTTAPMPNVLSYADRLSVAPGEVIEFKVSSALPGSFTADVVRLIHGDRNPEGPGFKERAVETTLAGEYPARMQSIDSGSLVRVDNSGPLALRGPFTLHAFIAPTVSTRPGQVIMGCYDAVSDSGYALELGPDGVSLRLGDGTGKAWTLATGSALYDGCWYAVAATYDPAAGSASVVVEPVVTGTNSRVGSVAAVPGGGAANGGADVEIIHAEVAFAIGAAANGNRFDNHFNGKIERPAVWDRVLSQAELSELMRLEGAVPRPRLIAMWDFADGIGPRGVPTDHVHDRGPLGLHGRCVNGPARAMTGRLWGGVDERFVHAPEQYAAIHFHDDDLEDCEWETDVIWRVPEDFPSGAYGFRVTQAGEVDRLPFFVIPPRGVATADVVLVIPTASYLAYANEHAAAGGAFTQAVFGHTPILGASDIYLHDHPELGVGLYDAHSDGSGTHLSSSHRPLVNLRPDRRTALGGAWQFPADLHLIDWLDEKGINYDVVTDLEIHQEGVELLGRYRVALTGSHPEYVSREMLEAWEAYLAGGGRGMYMGGNGFYWVTNWHPEKSHVIEMRRGETGIRAWQAAPGELHLQTNGERGGIWRWRGRAPQKVFGVGFATEGFDFATYFVQTKDVEDEGAAFIFDGIGRDERIGDFGLAGGGAAGLEMDRYDLSLGTPPSARLLAHSEGLSDNYPRVVEEIYVTMPHMGASMDYQARGDLVFFPTPKGGGVFSACSIAWCASLSHDEYDNNVSRVTENVLRRFMDPTPLS
jgi:N,N-dimethylformamidase